MGQELSSITKFHTRATAPWCRFTYYQMVGERRKRNSTGGAMLEIFYQPLAGRSPLPLQLCIALHRSGG